MKTKSKYRQEMVRNGGLITQLLVIFILSLLVHVASGQRSDNSHLSKRFPGEINLKQELVPGNLVQFMATQGKSHSSGDSLRDGFSMHWPQMPKPGGWDIGFTGSKLADDFLCTNSGQINHIRFWISWKNNAVQEIDSLQLSICENDFSVLPNAPGMELWHSTVYTGQFTSNPMPETPQGWYDPSTQHWIENEHEIWYEITVSLTGHPFSAEVGIMYWLVLDFGELTNIGWKESGNIQFNKACAYYSEQTGEWIPVAYPFAKSPTPVDLSIVLSEQNILNLEVTAMPDTLCAGEAVQLRAIISGGSGINDLTWFSIPVGFEDTTNNCCPIVTPELPTTYYAVLWDGYTWLADSVKVFVPTVACREDTALCIDEPCFPLTGCTPPGGTYSGNGVSGGVFCPGMAGVGTHTITYSRIYPLTGCVDSCTFDININMLPDVSCYDCDFGPYCENNTTPVALTCATPAGGEYSGSGVSFEAGVYYFNQSVAGVGTKTITYLFIDTNTHCTNSCSFNIVVNPLPGVSCANCNLGPYPVTNNMPVALTCATPAGGVYSGPGVSLFGGVYYFTPLQAGPGTHTITYSYNGTNGCSNFCTFTIIVLLIPPSQTIPYMTGWTWISFNRLPVTPTVNNVMSDFNAASGDILKNQTQTMLFNGTSWVPNLVIDPDKTYLLKTSRVPGSFDVFGSVIDPSDPIPINANGWTWIGYKPAVQMTPSQAFVSMTGTFTNGDLVKSQTQTALYNSSLNNWLPTTFKMNPGRGYKLKYQNATGNTLIYPSADGSANLPQEESNSEPAKWDDYDPGWVITPGMETNMSIFVKSITIDKIPVTNGKIAAFDTKTNQCRAVEEFLDADMSGQAILTIGFNSDEIGNSYYFLVWNLTDNIIYRANETSVMVADDFRMVDLTLISEDNVVNSNGICPLANRLSGDLKGNYLQEVQVSETSACGSKAHATYIKIFPNPTMGVFTIEANDQINRVEIFNAFGEKTYDIEPETFPATVDPSTQPKGIYFIRIESDSNVFFEKLILK